MYYSIWFPTMDYRSARLLLLLVGLSVIRVEGDYQVLVTVHSFVLLESRCAECYKAGDPIILRDSCCDGNNASSCPDSCDILLRFCELGDLSQSPLADRLVSFGTRCVRNRLSNYVEDQLGFNLNAGVTYPDFDEENGLTGGTLFRTDVIYNGTGQWKGAQLSILIIDTEPDDLNDLVDYFSIPINISAGSSETNNFTGIYNYAQLELTIEVRCTAQNNVNTDDNCVCLPGFTGQLCKENIDECMGVTCNGGGVCVDEVSGFHCDCSPGFTGSLCEVDINIDDCIGVNCSNRGRCVDGVQNYSCSCNSGYTGAVCEIEMISRSNPLVPVPLAAIIGGVVGGVVALFLLTILILLLILKWSTKSFSIHMHARNVQEDIDLHDYDEVDNETDIETKECAAYAIQKKVDLESNPAYIYAQIGDQAITIETKECVAYGTQDTVTTEANPAYQTVTEH